MPRLVRAAGVMLLAGLCTAAAMPAQAAGNATCVRELARTENTLVKTLVRVHGAAQAKGEERCAVHQDHVAIVSRVRDVFARCKTGADRDAAVNQLDGALSDANAVIAKTCVN